MWMRNGANKSMSEIKLDYDGIEFSDVKQIFTHRGWLVKYLKMESMTVSKTRHGYHLRISIKKHLADKDLLLVQILLGSDINREIYNLCRILNGELTRNWNRLYDKKNIVLDTRIGEKLSQERFLKGYTNELKKIIEASNDPEASL
jgi:hypothetical protein